jgi:hypothetical protein
MRGEDIGLEISIGYIHPQVRGKGKNEQYI